MTAPQPLPFPGRCNAINASGARCFSRTKNGERCPLHDDHDRVTTQALEPVYRCAGKSLDGDPCFVRVAERGDLCRVHRRLREREQMAREVNTRELLAGLAREAERLREQSDSLLQTVVEFREESAR